MKILDKLDELQLSRTAMPQLIEALRIAVDGLTKSYWQYKQDPDADELLERIAELLEVGA